MKKYYTLKEVCEKFTKFQRVKFETGQATANHYGAMTKSGSMNRNVISRIKHCVIPPTKPMLKDIGFEKVTMYKRIDKTTKGE